MIALKNFKYGGRAYAAGDEIQPWNERDAAVLRKTRLAEDKPAVVVEEPMPSRRGRYKRRDMRVAD